MSSLVGSRVACMFLLLIGCFLFGILPIFVQKALLRCECEGTTCKPKCRARRGKLVTSFLIYFGGGVLLGTCLLHLLPEAREGFETKSDHHDHDHDDVIGNATTPLIYFHPTGDDEGGETFPLAEFIVCCGFFAVYLFEEVIHFFIGGHSHVPSEAKAIRSLSRSSSCNSPHRQSDAGLQSSGEIKPGQSSELPGTMVCPAVPPDQPHKFTLAGLLTVAALSFHSLFEGFAVGLQKDASGTWMIFAAIALHKYVIAFVVGLEVLVAGGKNIQVYVYMAIFAFMSPIGMAIAMITEVSAEASSPVTVGVLNGIATGTLLYVTFFEILQRDEHKDIATWIQLIATFCGFALACIMQYIGTLA